MRRIVIAAIMTLGIATPSSAHEVRVGRAAAADPYAPFKFLIGDWTVSDVSGGPPIVSLRFHWADHHAYILYGAYIGNEPHFEGVMMWNGAHHNLDALISMDMERGLVQDLGTVSMVNGSAVRESIETISEGVSVGGPPSPASGSTTRTRQAMRPIDADHISLSFEIETQSGWKPAMPGGDHLLMTRAKA